MSNRDPLLRRWLLIRNGAVGDTVLLSSTVQAIRRQYPDAWIEVAGVQERVELLMGEGLANEAVSTERTGWETLFSQDASLHPDLASYFASFDTVVYYAGGHYDILRERIQQYPNQIVRIHPALPSKENDRRHVTQHYLDAFKGILNDLSPPLPRIRIGDEERDSVLNYFSALGIDRENTFLLALHVGAGGPDKIAPPERFAQTARFFHERMSAVVLVPEGPADEEAVEKFLKILPAEIDANVLKGKTLRELAAILNLSDLTIGNDSGVTHLATAVGCPTLAIFVSSDPEIWRPLGDRVRIAEWTT